ncbi:hypothetical protein HYFRA_00003710 [Hymenoscyphus fraxineus]|uniref:Heterokaryon incompatibility domain-containing protein n=1 Tax=Hymenoscyphus fraxineus TaxID=746836 RepID=A0A9N9PUL4_9HELO|nr:hypothetical protein HYFRA_00003710 [Hymenoscyphus fraxineus]
MRKAPRANSFDRNQLTYKYTPLPTANSIRLLHVYPSPSPNDSIYCSLTTVSLSSPPSYQALSYTWGDRSGLAQLLFKDRKGGTTALPVTQNLWRALQRLRPKYGKPLIIWADAVCINQHDVVERGAQISKMRGIYWGAESVCVWVGMGVRKSELGIGIAKDLNSLLSSNYPPNEEEKQRIRRLVRDPGRVDGLKSLVHLFRRQYWWRIWVIQEIALAKKATVYCGAESIPWEELDQVCSLLQLEVDYLSDLFYTRPSCVRTLTHGGPRGLQLSRYSPNTNAPPLLELLLSHKSKKSTDPRDKVFALIGISSSRATFGAIDYEKDVGEVYTHTARHIIQSTGKLDVVCVKQRDFSTEGLPSWAPDWSRPPPNSGSLMVGLHHRVPPFNAAGNTSGSFEFLGEDGDSLCAKGMRIDVIKTVGMPFRQKGAPKNIHTALHVLKDWWGLFSSCVLNPGSGSGKASFCRVISCGNWMFDENDPIYEERLRRIFEVSESLLLGDEAQSSTSLSSSVISLTEEGDEQEEIDVVVDKEGHSVVINASITMNRRRLFISERGIPVVGLAPWDALEGDVLVVLLGCKFPVVLRNVERHWVLVGEAYVDGYMDGEAMYGSREGTFSEEAFEIR